MQEGFAGFPNPFRKGIGGPVGQGRIAVRYDDHAEPDLRHVGIGEAAEDRDVDDGVVVAFPGEALGDDVGQRWDRRGGEDAGQHHIRLADRHDGRDVAAQHPHQRAGGAAARFVHIRVRRVVVTEQPVRQIAETRVDIAVQVRRHHNRQIGAEDVPRRLHEFLFRVGAGGRRHRAVQE